MSKAGLISIQPKWCEKIARGEKTIEVRKTRPKKLSTPFKCYIYCTASGITAAERDGNIFTDLRCKVIGHFICDKIDVIRVFDNGAIQDWNACELSKSCVDYDAMAEYIGAGKTGYGWHISNLVIYDKTKELGEFYKTGTLSASDFECQLYDGSGAPSRQSYASYLFTRAIRRPPQSWCYVEEGQSDG